MKMKRALRGSMIIFLALLAGSLAAQVGLSFAPAVFTTYAGTVIVSAVMAISGLTVNRLIT